MISAWRKAAVVPPIQKKRLRLPPGRGGLNSTAPALLTMVADKM